MRDFCNIQLKSPTTGDRNFVVGLWAFGNKRLLSSTTIPLRFFDPSGKHQDTLSALLQAFCGCVSVDDPRRAYEFYNILHDTMECLSTATLTTLSQYEYKNMRKSEDVLGRMLSFIEYLCEDTYVPEDDSGTPELLYSPDQIWLVTFCFFSLYRKFFVTGGRGGPVSWINFFGGLSSGFITRISECLSTIPTKESIIAVLSTTPGRGSITDDEQNAILKIARGSFLVRMFFSTQYYKFRVSDVRPAFNSADWDITYALPLIRPDIAPVADAADTATES